MNGNKERSVVINLIKFKQNFFFNKWFVEFSNLFEGGFTLMICFFDIFLMATCWLFDLARMTSPNDP